MYNIAPFDQKRKQNALEEKQKIRETKEGTESRPATSGRGEFYVLSNHMTYPNQLWSYFSFGAPLLRLPSTNCHMSQRGH